MIFAKGETKATEELTSIDGNQEQSKGSTKESDKQGEV